MRKQPKQSKKTTGGHSNNKGREYLEQLMSNDMLYHAGGYEISESVLATSSGDCECDFCIPIKAIYRQRKFCLRCFAYDEQLLWSNWCSHLLCVDCWERQPTDQSVPFVRNCVAPDGKVIYDRNVRE